MSVVKNAQHTPLTRAIMCQHEYHLHASGPWHRWIRRVCVCVCEEESVFGVEYKCVCVRRRVCLVCCRGVCVRRRVCVCVCGEESVFVCVCVRVCVCGGVGVCGGL